MKTPPECYYSFSPSDDESMQWSVIYKEQPICSKRTFFEAVRCAESFNLTPSEYFWNGFVGQYILTVHVEDATA
jgi:hypothetical protein